MFFFVYFLYFWVITINLQEFLNFIVKYKHECTTCTAENVRECSLEEGVRAFCLSNCGPAVEGALVNNFSLLATRLHHHTTSDSIEWIRDNTGNCGYNL